MPSSSKRKLVIGNWKMNPDTAEEAKRIIKQIKKTVAGLSKTDVVACPPFIFASFVLGKSGKAALTAKKKSLITLGAQDVHTEERGSYTGEVSALMIRDMGADYVIVGHSERRAVGETDEVVAKKAEAVTAAGLSAVVCVGEAVHDAQGAYLEPLKEQIKASLAKISKKSVNQIVMAYEPVWAIGAKEAMDPAVVQEMMIFIRKILSDMYGQSEVASVPILYGGSVNFRNAGDILEKGDVDGFLVGRESVNSSGFTELLKVVDAAR